MKQKCFGRRANSRLERIERKCDRIISEIVILRELIYRHPEIDDTIERLHKIARKMREQCESERIAVERLYSRNSPCQ